MSNRPPMPTDIPRPGHHYEARVCDWIHRRHNTGMACMHRTPRMPGLRCNRPVVWVCDRVTDRYPSRPNAWCSKHVVHGDWLWLERGRLMVWMIVADDAELAKEVTP